MALLWCPELSTLATTAPLMPPKLHLALDLSSPSWSLALDLTSVSDALTFRADWLLQDSPLGTVSTSTVAARDPSRRTSQFPRNLLSPCLPRLGTCPRCLWSRRPSISSALHLLLRCPLPNTWASWFLQQWGPPL